MDGVGCLAMSDTDLTWFTAKDGAGPREGVACVATCWIGALCRTLSGWGAVKGVHDVGTVWFTEFVPSAATEDGGAVLANKEGTSDGFNAPVSLLLAPVLGAELGWRGWAMPLQLSSTTELCTILETGATGVKWLEAGKE